jgi:hypothetical protein
MLGVDATRRDSMLKIVVGWLTFVPNACLQARRHAGASSSEAQSACGTGEVACDVGSAHDAGKDAMPARSPATEVALGGKRPEAFRQPMGSATLYRPR